MDIRAAKLQLRQSILERLSHLDAQSRKSESRSICKRLADILPRKKLTICAYVPLNEEVDIRPLIIALLKRGDSIYLPCFEHKRLVFREVKNLDQLQPGALRIPEPAHDAPVLHPQALDLAFVPGRAFDREGRRLGRGNGGYDVWIKEQRTQHAKTKFWGISFLCQIVDSIPMEGHDATMDAVITARGPLQEGTTGI